MLEEFPADVRKLIDESVRSVGHLETLLFLFERKAERFTALDLSREMRTNEAYAENQLRELSPLIEERDGRFQYQALEASDRTVQKLTELYRERRHAIINYIYSKPPDAIRSFAEAFRLKK